MGEYWEITFFSDKTAKRGLIAETLMNTLHVRNGRNGADRSSFPLLENRDLYFQVFEEPHFTAYQLSIMNLQLTKHTLDAQLDQMIQLISPCFNRAAELLFATGIYELTDYYLQGNNTIAEIVKYALPHYPLLFFRENGDCYGYESPNRSHGVLCVVQSGPQLQDIFTEKS